MLKETLRDISIYWAMIHILVLFMILFRSRYSRKKTFILTGMTIGGLMVINITILLLFGFQVLAQIFLLTCSLPSFIFFYILAEERNSRFIFTFCLADTISFWLMASTNLLDHFVGGGSQVVTLISRLILFPLLEIVTYRYLRKPYLELQAAVSKGWGVFTGMTVLYYLLLAVLVQYPSNIVNRPDDIPACILVLILMLFTYATMFTALYRQLLLYQKQQNERVLWGQKTMLEAQLENQQYIKRMKHDMKGHTAMLSGLLASGKAMEASQYLKKMETEIEASPQNICANPYLNAIFSYYSQTFQKLKVPLELDIQIGAEELPYMELSQILSNALENACDALEQLKPEERSVSVQMKYSRDYLVIRIKNRCRAELNVTKGSIPTTEKKGSGHGFGIPTIQEAARQLKGDMLCYTENQNFIVDVMVQH